MGNRFKFTRCRELHVKGEEGVLGHAWLVGVEFWGVERIPRFGGTVGNG